MIVIYTQVILLFCVFMCAFLYVHTCVCIWFPCSACFCVFFRERSKGALCSGERSWSGDGALPAEQS